MGIIERVITIETRLASTVEKLDRLIDTVEDKFNIYAGNDKTPSIIGRVIAIESFIGTVKWAIGILYTAMIGIVAAMIKDRV